MRRTILLGLFALFVVIAPRHACAQRRGGAGPDSAGVASVSATPGPCRPTDSADAYLPYDSGDEYPYAPQPAFFRSSSRFSRSGSYQPSRLRRPSSSRRCIL